MKKIINGKKYNTETAKEIARSESNYFPSDFYWYRETLYQKKTGEYFLHGGGNAMSKYSLSVGGNGRVGDERIIPLSEEEAIEFAEKNLDVDEFEKIFGEVEE